MAPARRCAARCAVVLALAQAAQGLGAAPRSLAPRGRVLLQSAAAAPTEPLLKQTAKWGCMSGCGACCYLEPTERDDLDSWLTPEDRTLYDSMTGDDGWCIHFDKETRLCGQYEERPGFCRVTPETFETLYGVELEFMDSFCTQCCREHIGGVHGAPSKELTTFNKAIKQLRREAADEEKAAFKLEAQRLVDDIFDGDEGDDDDGPETAAR
ncbi:hypothetical protein M885DRAFT_616694 [Pelagophyceae sp. CCMP2097]|nr:hypothetical protein M885DRAFT_616694 [Pelagophyceae sp. CCMP2097]